MSCGFGWALTWIGLQLGFETEIAVPAVLFGPLGVEVVLGFGVHGGAQLHSLLAVDLGADLHAQPDFQPALWRHDRYTAPFDLVLPSAAPEEVPCRYLFGFGTHI